MPRSCKYELNLNFDIPWASIDNDNKILFLFKNKLQNTMLKFHGEADKVFLIVFLYVSTPPNPICIYIKKFFIKKVIISRIWHLGEIMKCIINPVDKKFCNKNSLAGCLPLILSSKMTVLGRQSGVFNESIAEGLECGLCPWESSPVLMHEVNIVTELALTPRNKDRLGNTSFPALLFPSLFCSHLL